MTAHQKLLARKQAQDAFPALTECERCPATEWLERHHPDILNDPLAIIVLCKGCHVAEHKRTGTWSGPPGPASSGPQLVYMRIADDFASKIERGELRPGDQLPPGTVIAEKYGVATLTAGRALRELRERGLVRSIRGHGTSGTSRVRYS